MTAADENHWRNEMEKLGSSVMLGKLRGAGIGSGAEVPYVGEKPWPTRKAVERWLAGKDAEAASKFAAADKRNFWLAIWGLIIGGLGLLVALVALIVGWPRSG